MTGPVSFYIDQKIIVGLLWVEPQVCFMPGHTSVTAVKLGHHIV